jgi:hypothetical protein
MFAARFVHTPIPAGGHPSKTINKLTRDIMNTLLKMASGIFTAGILLLASTASAAPVSFSITGATFTPGTGYGQDANENNATMLDVRFSTSAFVAQSFTLSAGAFTNFTFGTIGLFESTDFAGIVASETDNLNVTAALTFVSPVGTPQSLFATGTTTLGTVIDASVDYIIDWEPIFVAFGDGGFFQIDLNDLGFTNNSQTQTQSATIRLVQEPTVPPIGAPVPEPSTIALFGLGLLGAAFARHKSGAGSA